MPVPVENGMHIVVILLYMYNSVRDCRLYNSYDLMGTRVVIQSATVVEVESSSTSTTITTITDATTVNGNKLRIMATRKI